MATNVAMCAHSLPPADARPGSGVHRSRGAASPPHPWRMNASRCDTKHFARGRAVLNIIRVG